MRALPYDDPLIREVIDAVKSGCENVEKMSDHAALDGIFENSESFLGVEKSADGLGEGKMVYKVIESPTLFYRALSKECDCEIADEFDLMRKLKTLTYAKKRYDKVSSALDTAAESGYGVAMPVFDDLELDEPVIEKKGGKYGVKLKAKAPSYHIVRVDVNAEVSPLMGAQMQSEESVKQLLESLKNGEESLWKTNVFGKSLEDVIVDNIHAKADSMQIDTKNKMRRAMGRIVNEGKGGVICILL
jgi:stage IV sporulation protein A